MSIAFVSATSRRTISGGDRFRRVFYGYCVLLICTMIRALGFDESFYGFSVFYIPILLKLAVTWL